MATSKQKAGEPALVRCKPIKVLALAGQGAPESAAFQDAIKALYGVAYAIKMTRKHGGAGADFKVGALEGLWETVEDPRDAWRWKLIIGVPSSVTAAELRAAKAAKKITAPIALETLREGTAVEALHVGPYATEPITIQAMRAFMAEHALRARGPHHEIYLGDPRRTAPARLKTILRQPVGPAS